MERNIFFTDYMMAGWYQCFGAAAAGALQELSKAKRKKNEKKIIVAITLVLDIRGF